LVRVNLGGSGIEPFESPFTISKVNNQKIEHMRVYHYKDRSGYFIQYKSKTATTQVYAKGGLEKLISKLKRKGILRKNGGVPGQKYKSIFESEENADIAIYLQIDKDEEPCEVDNADSDTDEVLGDDVEKSE